MGDGVRDTILTWTHSHSTNFFDLKGEKFPLFQYSHILARYNNQPLTIFMFAAPFSFEGRIRRLEYGLSYLIYMLLYFIAAFIWQEFQETSVIFFLFYAVLIWFILAQGAKRCHDLGNSGFFQLIPFYALWLVFQDGKENENKYGANPKKRVSDDTMKSRKVDSLKSVFVKISSPVLLNTLLIAIAMEYLYTNEIILFLWMVLSIFICYFLMLLASYKGFSLPDTHQVLLRLPIVYSVVLYICIRLYSISFRNTEILVQTIYLEVFIAGLILAVTYIPYLFYKVLFKKRVRSYEA